MCLRFMVACWYHIRTPAGRKRLSTRYRKSFPSYSWPHSSFILFLTQVAGLERHWHPLYFIFLPPNEDISNCIKLMERVSHVIPIHANVYWISQSGDKDTSREEFRIWETYSVKGLAVVQPLSTGHIQNLSCLRNLVEDKWRRRQDFRGSVITATAVVPTFVIFTVNLMVT